jgi:2-oxoglutarate dehydrogenase E1 component
VKYHLGYSHDRTTAAGNHIHLSLSANPSHLEAVNPVVEGIARAKQDHMADVDRGHVVPVLMHGDAAFTGQGVVAETLTLSELDGYRTGGTIHVIVNNQIGFTTPPEAYRATRTRATWRRSFTRPCST